MSSPVSADASNSQERGEVIYWKQHRYYDEYFESVFRIAPEKAVLPQEGRIRKVAPDRNQIFLLLGERKPMEIVPYNYDAAKDGSIQSIAVGHRFTLALSENGKVLHYGTSKHVTTTFIDSLVRHRVVKIAAGDQFGMVLTEKGTVHVWGLHLCSFGSMRAASAVPMHITSLDAKGIVKIYACRMSMAALSKDGKLYSWGDNSKGTLGHPFISGYQPMPLLVQGPMADKNIVKFRMGSTVSAAVTNNNEVWAWGYLSSRPIQLKLPTDDLVVDIGCSQKRVFILTKSRQMFSCGLNWYKEATNALPRSFNLELGPHNNITLDSLYSAYYRYGGYSKKPAIVVEGNSTYLKELEPLVPCATKEESRRRNHAAAYEAADTILKVTITSWSIASGATTIKFSNSKQDPVQFAVGIDPEEQFVVSVFFPFEDRVQPVYMSFHRRWLLGRVLDLIAHHAKIKDVNNSLAMDDPKRLHLFNLATLDSLPNGRSLEELSNSGVFANSNSKLGFGVPALLLERGESLSANEVIEKLVSFGMLSPTSKTTKVIDTVFIKAHSFILHARCPLARRYLDKILEENQGRKPEHLMQLEITAEEKNFTTAAVYAVLGYLYTGDVKIFDEQPKLALLARNAASYLELHELVDYIDRGHRFREYLQTEIAHNLKKDMKRLISSQPDSEVAKLADVVFELENGLHRLYAHKVLCEARSPHYLKLLLNASTKDGGEGAHAHTPEGHTLIRVDNVSYKSFKCILEYLYSDEPTINEECAVEVMCKASEYQLELLATLAERVISFNLDEENVSTVLELAEAYNRKQLTQLCQYIIKELAREEKQRAIRNNSNNNNNNANNAN